MNYYYFLSSLPSLTPGVLPELTAAQFNELAREQMSGEDFALLESVLLQPSQTPSASLLGRRFSQWETNLRNALLPFRTEGSEVENFKQHEDDYFSEIEGIAQEAHAKSNPLEREIWLDQARFAKLDELSSLEPFSGEALVAYRLKLDILEKYRPRTPEQGRENFEALVQAIVK